MLIGKSLEIHADLEDRLDHYLWNETAMKSLLWQHWTHAMPAVAPHLAITPSSLTKSCLNFALESSLPLPVAASSDWSRAACDVTNCELQSKLASCEALSYLQSFTESS